MPEGKGHGIEASLHFAEKHPRRLHLQAVHLVGIPLVDGGPLPAVLGLWKVDYISGEDKLQLQAS